MKTNIKNEILQIVNNIPNVSPLEKVRWVYIKLGKLFSFDYKYLDTQKEATLDSEVIDRYQTCVQISEILNEILNKIDPNIKSEVIERKNINRPYNKEHVCNVITIGNEKYLLDLSLDLYRIHFDLKTKDFGYSGHPNMELDIISQNECTKMDKALGLYPNGYTDDKIKKTREELSFMDFRNMTFEEEIEYRLLRVNMILNMNDSYNESNLFLYNEVVDSFINCQTIRTIIRNNDEQRYVYIFIRNGEYVIYMYDENNRFYKTTINVLKGLLDNGWDNKKGLLYDFIDLHSSHVLS